MRATRGLFWSVNVLLWALNGWTLLQVVGLLPALSHAVTGTLIANIVIIPFLMWSAYRTGQIVEDTFGRNAKS